jgi:hypothetical protein
MEIKCWLISPPSLLFLLFCIVGRYIPNVENLRRSQTHNYHYSPKMLKNRSVIWRAFFNGDEASVNEFFPKWWWIFSPIGLSSTTRQQPVRRVGLVGESLSKRWRLSSPNMRDFYKWVSIPSGSIPSGSIPSGSCLWLLEIDDLLLLLIDGINNTILKLCLSYFKTNKSVVPYPSKRENSLRSEPL